MDDLGTACRAQIISGQHIKPWVTHQNPGTAQTLGTARRAPTY